MIFDAGHRSGEIEEPRRHHPRHVAVVVGRGRLDAPAERRRRCAQPDHRLLRRLLEILGERVLLVRPFRHAHELDIGLDRLGDRLVGKLRPGRGGILHIPGGAGHQRSAFGDLEELVVSRLGGRHAGVADEPPDLAGVGNDVGLHTAGDDGAVRPIGRTQMLAQLVEADVHQLDRIDRVLAVPRVDRAVRRLAMKGEDGADRGVVLQAVAGREHLVDVQVDDGVDVLEVASAHDERAARELLLGRPEGDRDRARNVVPGHHLLHRECRHGGDPAVGVVAFHVAGPARHQRLALIGARRLRAARQGIDLGDDRDLGMAGAVFGPETGRHAGAPELDPEACCRERVLEQPGALHLLHAELAEIEQRVADVGHLLGVAVDHFEGERLARIGPLAGPGGANGESRQHESRHCNPHAHPRLHVALHCLSRAKTVRGGAMGRKLAPSVVFAALVPAVNRTCGACCAAAGLQ